MTEIAIAGVGLATACGDAAHLACTPDAAIPWPLRPTCESRRFRPVPDLGDADRFAALIRRALAGCGGGGPLLVASCNGRVATWDPAAWQTSFDPGPVTSAACASGLHALYLARCMIDAGTPEVTVVAVDAVTPPAHDNFEALRVLSDAPAPFRSAATGFQLGETAVALRIVRADLAPHAPRLLGPVLGHDLDDDDGLVRVLTALGRHEVELVIGQGAGPVEGDRAELAAIATAVPLAVPLTTALAGFGHALGASSLLSVALATLAIEREIAPLALGGTALDGRPLGAPRSTRTLVTCRALGGACGACLVAREVAPLAPGNTGWGPSGPEPVLRNPVLRRIADVAHRYRPTVPPDLLLVTLDAPLPPSARIGSRILPTSVLEMTPGFVPQLIARSWGYRGPATCLVGGDPEPLIAACRATRQVFRVAIRGMEQRDVEWNA